MNHSPGEARNSQRLLLNGPFRSSGTKSFSPRARACAHKRELYHSEYSCSSINARRQSLNGIVHPDVGKRRARWPCLIILFWIARRGSVTEGETDDYPVNFLWSIRGCFTFHLFKAKPRGRDSCCFQFQLGGAIVGLISHKSSAVFVDWVTVSFVPRPETHRFRSEVIKCRDRHVDRYRISPPRPFS